MADKWWMRFGERRPSTGGSRARSQSAINATLTPVAIGQIISSVESLTTGSLYGPTALLRGMSARTARPGTLRHAICTALDAPATPKILAAVSLAGATTLLAGPKRRGVQIVAASVIGACNRLNEIRTPYGRDGADQMTAVITQYRALSALIPNRDRSDDLFLRAVNLQAGLSYFVSGMSKLFGSSWIQGDALGEIIQTQAYGGGPAAEILRRHPRLNRVLTWMTPLWESAFPVVYLLSPGKGQIALVGVKVFHVGVASVMELPRFIWGFFGSHGAIQYVLDGDRRRGDRLERVVLGAAAATALTAGIYATTQRALDIDRRSGLKGTELLEMDDGVIEYRWIAPRDSTPSHEKTPVVILESGLGNPLDAWAWVESNLPEAHIVSYHRRGYGRTTSKAAPREAVRALVAAVGSKGPLIGVSHSIGVLAQAEYAGAVFDGQGLSAVVIVDGTDPDLLEADRTDRRRIGSFLQAQAHTMFSAVSGIYNFAPNDVARQSRYEPDQQQGTLQFVFAPRNIYRATREYFAIGAGQAIESLQGVPRRYLVASDENARQQQAFAEKIAADYRLLPETTHRSIIGFRGHGIAVAAVVKEAIDAAR